MIAERAAIMEFDGHLTREQAEAAAVACCIPGWWNPELSHQQNIDVDQFLNS